jgi:hypothetical protein
MRLPAGVQAEFERGLSVTKLAEAKFNSVWLGNTLDTTENKAFKGSGGII